MSARTRLGALEAKVKRLEAAAGKGRRNCPRCRLYSSALPPGLEIKPSDDVVREKCEFCHSEYFSSLKGMSEAERKVGRLIARSTTEDSFTDPKVRASWYWFKYRPNREERVEGAEQALQDRAKSDSRLRAFLKLDEEYDRVFDLRIKSLKAKYGEDPFPEITRLIKDIQDRARSGPPDNAHISGLRDLEEEETGRLICAELEKIMFGEVMRSTAAALDDVRSRIALAVAEVVEEKRRREETSRSRDHLQRSNEMAGTRAPTPRPSPNVKDDPEDMNEPSGSQSETQKLTWLDFLPPGVRKAYIEANVQRG